MASLVCIDFYRHRDTRKNTSVVPSGYGFIDSLRLGQCFLRHLGDHRVNSGINLIQASERASGYLNRRHFTIFYLRGYFSSRQSPQFRHGKSSSVHRN